MRQLREDLARARELLNFVAEREGCRRESLCLEEMIFEQRVLVRRIKKKLGVTTTEKDLLLASLEGASPENKKSKKRNASHASQMDESRYDCIFLFAVAHVNLNF
jgi:hypothetical protein